MNIIVIAGGLSPERDVSLSSGSLIANALIDAGYRVYLMDLYLGIELEDFDEAFVDSESGGRFNYIVPQHEPDLNQIKKDACNGGSVIGKNVIEACRKADLVFMALHGDIGENGKLQAIFDSFGIPYTGTGYIGSMLAMDKDLSKRLMLQNQILTPEWQLVDLGLEDISGAISLIGFPCVIKPCDCGSSIGVSIVKDMDELNSAVSYAKKYTTNIIIEKMISGREFSVGILDNNALPVIEIIPDNGFYNYENKYQPGYTKEICPAQLSHDIESKMKDMALHVHKLLRLGSYSRIDFMLDNYNNIYCLEANTLPGMTPTSLLPQEAAAAGISYNKLCDKIVKLAARKY